MSRDDDSANIKRMYPHLFEPKKKPKPKEEKGRIVVVKDGQVLKKETGGDCENSG